MLSGLGLFHKVDRDVPLQRCPEGTAQVLNRHRPYSRNHLWNFCS